MRRWLGFPLKCAQWNANFVFKYIYTGCHWWMRRAKAAGMFLSSHQQWKPSRGLCFQHARKKAGPLPQLIMHELAHMYSIVVSLTDGSGLKPCSWGKWTLGLPVMFRTLNSFFAKITFPQEGSFATKTEKYWQLKNKFKKFFLLSVLKNTLYYFRLRFRGRGRHFWETSQREHRVGGAKARPL